MRLLFGIEQINYELGESVRYKVLSALDTFI